MVRPLSRRTVLSLLAVSGVALVAACSDSGQTPKAEAPAEPAPPADAPAATPPASTVAAPASEGSVDMAKLLEPGALPEMTLGNADAPVTIVEYASMTCPHCA